MTTINLGPYKPVSGALVDAAPIDNAFDTIQNAINGGLDDENVAAGGPPIVGTKLAKPPSALPGHDALSGKPRAFTQTQMGRSSSASH